MRKMIVATAVATLLSIVATDAWAAVQYTVTDLGPPGNRGSYASAINNSGQVVGYVWDTEWSYVSAFLYSNGTMTELGTFGGDPNGISSFAEDINASGQVAINEGGQSDYAVLFSDGILTNLGTLPGTSSSFISAHGINDSAQVVGECLMAYVDHKPIYHSFLYSNGSMTELAAPLEYPSTHANDINNSGQVVGSMTNAANTVGRAYLYTNGSMHDIGALAGCTYAQATAINDNGQIAGSSYLPGEGGWHHAFLYSDNVMTDLGALGGDVSRASDINNRGQVVGMYINDSDGDTSAGAFIYTDGTMFDLNTLIDPTAGWKLDEACGINDFGMIVGSGINAAGLPRAFLLTPIPEPSALALLSIGAVSVLAYTSRKRMKARISRHSP